MPHTQNGCTRCQVLPTISLNKGHILVSCEVPELAHKFSLYLSEKNIIHTFEDAYTLWITIPSFKEFLLVILENKLFDSVEAKAIRLLFLENEMPFTPASIREAKTIQAYNDFIHAQELSVLITKGAITTHFQPIIELETQTIYGYESLARGVKDDGTLIYPDKLFAWAREGDMLFYLDRACRETSLKTAAVKNITSKVFINFIPTAIYDPAHCLSSTVRWAKQLDFNPQNIIFEVVESDLVNDIGHLKKILDYYKSQGFMVALDDVGSGYSTLNMVAQLLPNIVKIGVIKKTGC